MKTMDIPIPRSAFETARRNARYGHRDWLVWKSKDGDQQAGILNRDNLKSALMACGTRSTFALIHANCATGQVVGWAMGTLMLRNLKFRGQ
jgi:hypothetical protein